MMDEFARSVDAATTLGSRRLVDSICDGVLAREFSVAFQPIIDVHSGHTVGAGALLRWQHPKFGQLFPGAFAEALLAPEAAWATTAFVIDEVCRQLSASTRSSSGANLQFVSFNVLPYQLDEQWLEALIRWSTKSHRVQPSQLLIELLEHEPILDHAQLQQNIERLQQLGVRVAIDDFGSGAWTLSDLAKCGEAKWQASESRIIRCKNEADCWQHDRPALGFGSCCCGGRY